MSASLKEDFAHQTNFDGGSGGGGGGDGPHKTIHVVLPNEDGSVLREYILKSIQDSADMLKLRMTTRANLDHNILFSVVTNRAGWVDFTINCADTLESSLKKLDREIRIKLFNRNQEKHAAKLQLGPRR